VEEAPELEWLSRIRALDVLQLGKSLWEAVSMGEAKQPTVLSTHAGTNEEARGMSFYRIQHVPTSVCTAASLGICEMRYCTFEY